MVDTADRVVGTSVLRKEDAELITGQGKYTDDLKVPGMLHMVLVRSPFAHARVRSVDLSAAKGASSGYWPFGFAAASGEVFDTITGAGPFVHGFTHSHAAPGAAVALAVLRKLRTDGLVEASRVKGERLLKELTATLGSHPNVGDIRGLGLMIGVEFVADRETRQPFPRAERVTERLVAACKEDGLLLYSSTGLAGGTDGDLLMFGPPFVITDKELSEAVAKTAAAVARVLG